MNPRFTDKHDALFWMLWHLCFANMRIGIHGQYVEAVEDLRLAVIAAKEWFVTP